MADESHRAGYPAMTTAQETFAAGLALGLRTPLARVELAASQLEREAGTPAARRLAEGIGEAVSELDGRIAQLTSVLAPPTSPDRVAQPLSGVLHDLRGRLAPVLAARGLEWEDAGPDCEAAGDPEMVRLTALAMIRAGAEIAGEGGRLALALQIEAGRAGLLLSTFHGPGKAAFASIERPMRELRGRVLTQGGSLEIEQSAAACIATVWFAHRENPCTES